MIVTLKIEITNQIVLDQYAKLLKAQGKGSESATSQSNELEKVITQTLFRGTRVQSGSTGVSAPDFMITDQGMTSLLSTVIGPQILEGEKFADFVGQQLAGDSVSMEAKLLRTNDSGEIKIGQFSIDSDSEKINYYDFTTSQVIDTTRFSVLNALRQNYSSDTAAQPVAQKELKPNPKKSDLFAFIKGISPEFQQFIKKDKAYTALFAMLSADNTVRNTSAEANNLVNQINNRWSEKSLRAELTRLSVSNRLFDYIVKTPELKNQFYSKSRLLSIFRQQENKATALVLSFSETDFTSKFFGARLEGDSIKVFIKSDVEKTFLKELQDKAPSLIMGNNLTEYNKAVEQLKNNHNQMEMKNYLGTTVKYVIPTGGSIPMSKAYLNFHVINNKRVNTPYVSSSTYIPQQKNFGQFVSAEYLRLEIIKKMMEEMPQGPIGGRITQPDILTYRTGRFVNSLELMIDYRNAVVSYYYNPIYYVHEKTSRNPQILIERSIQEVLAERFKQTFKINEVYQF